jgi:hypothetical protein
MKKNFFLLLTIGFTCFLLFLPGCRKKPGTAIKDIALLKMVPDDAAGIFYVNVKRLTELEFFEEKISGLKKNEAEQSKKKILDCYLDFLENTGVDIERDIHGITIAFFSAFVSDLSSEKDADAIILFELDYDRDKILAVVKDKLQENEKAYAEETYKDCIIFKLTDSGVPFFTNMTIENAAFSFINNKTIAVGKPGKMKRVIDLSQGTGKSILLCEQMESYLNTPCSAAMASFAFIVPEELKKKYENGLFQFDLSKAEIVSGNIDQRSKVWEGEFKLISKNARGNAQLISVLAFVKTLAGATLGAEFSEMIDNIHLSSSAEDITLTFAANENELAKLYKKINDAQIGLSALTGEK